MTDRQILLRGRLDGKQRNRLKGLLNMMYRPSELAEEIGIDQNQVYRVYVPLGCPHERDRNRHLWINGENFREWYQDTYKQYQPKEGEVYCPSCKVYRIMGNPEHHFHEETKTAFDIFICPECGKKASKFAGRGG
jgi:hypothetical protein